MYIEVESRAEALDQSHCTSRPVLEPVSSFVDQVVDCRKSSLKCAGVPR
jgi:hypothetical protein